MQSIERFLRLWSLEITVSNWSCSLFETFFFFSSVKNMTRTNWDRILKLCVNIFETDSWPLDINLGWKQFSLGKLFVCAKQLTLIGGTSIVNDFALCSRLDFRCRRDSLQRKLLYGWYRLVCFICGGFCYQISGKRDSAVCWTSSFKVYTVKKKIEVERVTFLKSRDQFACKADLPADVLYTKLALTLSVALQ